MSSVMDAAMLSAKQGDRRFTWRILDRGLGTSPAMSIGRCSKGFTLIEVVVAMVIVAIGLLALEGLGIRGVRAVALADHRSRSALTASDSLTSALHQLRRGIIPSGFCVSVDGHTRVERRIVFESSTLAEVTVSVLRSAASEAMTDSFSVSSAVYLPQPLAGEAAGGGCD